MKAASTTIETSLSEYAELKRIYPFNNKHFPLRQIVQSFPEVFEAEGLAIDAFIVFGVVREPRDWLLSWFNYRSREALADPGHGQHDQYCGAIGFEEFAAEVLKPNPRPFGYVRRQFEFLTTDGSLDCDYVVDFSSFDRDFAELVSILELCHDPKRILKTRNRTERIRLRADEVDWNRFDDLMAFLEPDFDLLRQCEAMRPGQARACREKRAALARSPVDPATAERLLRRYWRSLVASHIHGPTKGVAEEALAAELDALDRDVAVRDALDACLV